MKTLLKQNLIKKQYLYLILIVLSLLVIIYSIWTLFINTDITNDEKLTIRQAIIENDYDQYGPYLKDGEQMSFVYDNGMTIIELLIAENDYESVKLLLDNGYDLNLIDYNHIEIISNLVSYNEDLNNDELNEIIKQLIEQVSSEVNNEDLTGYSLLINAIHSKNNEIVSYLFNYNINIDKRYIDQPTLLYACNSQGSINNVKTLVKHEVNINAIDDAGENCLFYAINRNDLELATYLINETKINLNHQNNREQTALHTAISSEAFDIASILIDNNVDLNLKDVNGDTAFQSIFKYQVSDQNYFSSVKQLIDHMLKNGADVNTVNDQGFNSLYYAIGLGDLQLVDYLLNHTDISLTQTDPTGRNALLFAVLNNRPDISSLLIEKDINPLQEDNNGKHALAASREKGYTDLVEQIENK